MRGWDLCLRRSKGFGQFWNFAYRIQEIGKVLRSMVYCTMLLFPTIGISIVLRHFLYFCLDRIATHRWNSSPLS